MAAQENEKLQQLQARWKDMFQKTLPAAATSKSDAQSKWPVHVDHCFARIILDATVGIDSPWISKIKSPAYKHITPEQLETSTALGTQILTGEADLVELDNKSLELRGKGSGKASGKISTAGVKRKPDVEAQTEEGHSKRYKPSPPPEKDLESPATEPLPTPTKEDLTPHLKKIALSSQTAFQKRVLTALCQVPRGQHSTYGALATHLCSSPRAVGNALRSNPFAPHVPCHRILASGGGLGGFHGSWGRKGQEGAHDARKRALLRGEGVRFDGAGRVVGRPWVGFR